MFDQSVMTIQVIKIELESQLIGITGDSCGSDDGSEVCSNVETVLETFDEDGDVVALSGAGTEVVVCETVEAGTGRADVSWSRA
jgi:hypothetical protein